MVALRGLLKKSYDSIATEMVDSIISLVATMTPHLEKMDRCIEIMTEATRIVHRTEPGALRYHLHVETKGDQRGESIVFLEEYESQAAWDKHCQGEAYNYMSQTMGDEGILAKAPSITFIRPIAGWVSR